MKVVRILVALSLLGGAGALTLQGLKERPPPAIDVQIVKARKGSVTRTISGAGKLQASTSVKISSNHTGDLTELHVKEGDRVKKGQVLGRIDQRRLDATLKQTQAAQSAARAEVSLTQVEVDRTAAEILRVTGLVQKGAASQSELDRLNAERDAALARNVASKERHVQAAAYVEDAVYNLSRTTLTSPIEGTVIELSREVGEQVRGSDFSEDVVMVIAALAAMEVRIEAGEHEVIHLKAGQKAEITVDAFEGQVFSGTVVEIAQKALIKNQGTEAEVTSFPVTVALDSRPPGALPGMSSEVRIATETHEDAIIVPVQAITARSEKSLTDGAAPVAAEGKALTVKRRAESLVKVAFVVDAEQRVHPRRVKTGIASDADLEILEGLADGDRVVEGPYRTLSKELKDKDLVREEEPGKGPGSKSGHGRRSL